MPDLNESQRRSVFRKVLETVDKKFMGPEPDTKVLAENHEREILQSTNPEDFEQRMNRMLRDLGASHTGFFHESAPRAAGRIAIAATFTKAETTDGSRWVFQDVHPGGVAAQAGIRPGDSHSGTKRKIESRNALLTIDQVEDSSFGRNACAPVHGDCAMGVNPRLQVGRRLSLP